MTVKQHDDNDFIDDNNWLVIDDNGIIRGPEGEEVAPSIDSFLAAEARARGEIVPRSE
jgi:hypothetical protein